MANSGKCQVHHTKWTTSGIVELVTFHWAFERPSRIFVQLQHRVILKSNTIGRNARLLRIDMTNLAAIAVATFLTFGTTNCLAHDQATETPPTANQVEGQAKKDDAHSHDGTQKHKHTNSLAKETSPYLLMHAHNPVNWYAWNEEALAKAKAEKKPIFLSVGYSSCHWCHVMERESFYDEEIAKFLNDNFVCIKVDREERPDVDSIYMESLHVLNRMMRKGGSGGWPLSMFLTPDGRPFYGGTYFPARAGDRGARVGFFEIATMVNKNWKERPERINKDADVVTKYTRASLAGREPSGKEEIDSSWITEAQKGLKENFDPDYGGFRFKTDDPNIPKFPEPSNLFFLADVVRRNPENEQAKTMLVKTCEQMMIGGIYDHLGGGFHRYSVDRFWAIPHFEKMLYDNGQLATVYSEVYQLTGDEEFKSVVDGILEWVSREMVSEKKGFYSALDAESEGEEGKFYRWELSEVKTALSKDEYKLFAELYGLNKTPNFESKWYAPQLSQSLSENAKAKGKSFVELVTQLKPIRKKLFDVRAKRPRPLLDDKILSGWNGMMIRGYADAGRLLKNKSYVDTAAKAGEFVIKHLVREDGRLWRTHTKGESKLNAYLDDYANVIDGFIALHKATGDQRWLDQAARIQKKQDELFWDEAQGGYYYTSSDHEQLLVRGKKPIDGAVPAGNSVSANNLLYLADKTNEAAFKDRAKQTVLSASGILDEFPVAAPRLLISAQEFTK